MSQGLHTSLIGILIAFIFAVSMSFLLTWMLRVPPQVSQTVAKVRRSFGAIKSIVVPTIGTFYSSRGIELACRLGMEQKTDIILIYVLEIPMVSPLNVSAPEAEEKAKEVLESGRQLVELHGLPCRMKVQRARTAGTGIIQAAQDEKADMIVMGIKTKTKGEPQEIVGKTTNYLLKRATCEVIIDRLVEANI